MEKASSKDLKDFAFELGFDLVGITEPQPLAGFPRYLRWIEKGFHGEMAYLAQHVQVRQDPSLLLEGCRSVVMVGLNYNQEPALVEKGRPRVARYALGRDYHKVLKGKLKKLAAEIERSHPGSQSRACVDSAPIFEREYAHLAGLGWFGKNTMLINSHRGSWFFLGALLTTVEYPIDEPSMGGCGTCTRCVDACPTGAIVHEDGFWQVRSGDCISYLTIEKRGDFSAQERSKIGGWTYGCDICQEVCPFNTPRESQPLRAQMTGEPDFLQRSSWPGLAELAQLSEEGWNGLTTGKATRRAGLEGLRRNAKANLENGA